MIHASILLAYDNVTCMSHVIDFERILYTLVHLYRIEHEMVMVANQCVYLL